MNKLKYLSGYIIQYHQRSECCRSSEHSEEQPWREGFFCLSDYFGLFIILLCFVTLTKNWSVQVELKLKRFRTDLKKIFSHLSYASYNTYITKYSVNVPSVYLLLLSISKGPKYETAKKKQKREPSN